ncbi:MAG: hypothetical protein JSU72_12685 [Deltaproteobacteria bacterium]|nr:MAG: hypothetical protein JSU72_12685 [Deltaproteobacteria bacterium]
MKKRPFLIGVMVITFVLTGVGVSRAGSKTGKRQIRQQKRIARGVRSGEITDREYIRLNREQARIQRAKRGAREDGRSSLRERRKLNRMQDRASKHIYRAKHNRKLHYNHRLSQRARRGMNHYNHRRPYRYRYHHYHRNRSPYWREHGERVHYSDPVRDYGSRFSATISQPDFSIAWSVDLD